jgi:hypothetical protein
MLIVNDLARNTKSNKPVTCYCFCLDLAINLAIRVGLVAQTSKSAVSWAYRQEGRTSSPCPPLPSCPPTKLPNRFVNSPWARIVGA